MTYRSYSLESLGVSVSKELILERLNKLNATKGGSPNLLPHFDRFMGEKKMHEVIYILSTLECDPPLEVVIQRWISFMSDPPF